MSLLWSLVARKSWYVVRQEKGAIRARGGSIPIVPAATQTQSEDTRKIQTAKFACLAHAQISFKASEMWTEPSVFFHESTPPRVEYLLDLNMKLVSLNGLPTRTCRCMPEMSWSRTKRTTRTGSSQRSWRCSKTWTAVLFYFHRTPPVGELHATRINYQLFKLLIEYNTQHEQSIRWGVSMQNIFTVTELPNLANCTPPESTIILFLICGFYYMTFSHLQVTELPNLANFTPRESTIIFFLICGFYYIIA